MKVESINLHGALSGGVHYILPHFQRQYTWELRNWKDLLEDVRRVYKVYDDQKQPEHFMGALVVVNDGTIGVSIPAYKLVDGQQRLTTISLMLRALYEVTPDERLRRRIIKYLVNEDEDEHVRYKLLPTLKNGDRDTFIHVVDTGDHRQNSGHTSSAISLAYKYLADQLKRWVQEDNGDPEKIFKVISSSFQFVFIKIEEQERPYAIFESLNAKGKPLTQTDLVRNYIAMKLPGKDQERLFNQYWAKIDDLLSEDRTVARIGELTAFLRHYLAFRTGVVDNMDMIYVRFRERMESQFGTPELFEQELKTLHQFAVWYNRLIRPETEPEEKLREALKRLNVLETTTAYPVILAAYDAYAAGKLTLGAFLDGLRVLENYQLRRVLVGDTTYTNRMFPSIIRMLTYSDFPNSLRRLLASRRAVPDHRLRQEVPGRSLYDRSAQSRLVFILQEVERSLWKGEDGYPMLNTEPTLEHILPQKPDKEWEAELGTDLNETKEYVHTLGNLTLITRGLNSSLSNQPFSHKRRILQDHVLRINSHYFEQPPTVWNAESIQKRALWLIDKIIAIWPALSDEIETEIEVYIPPESVTGKTAVGLMFMGEEYPIKSWREMMLKMVELGITLYQLDFEELAQCHPNYFPDEPSKNTTTLSNGRPMYHIVSAKDALRICRSVADILDIEEGREWRPIFN